MNTAHGPIVAGLLLWSILSMGTALAGLYARPRPIWHAFWFMSGVWGFIDALIGWFALLGDPAPLEKLVPILKINAGLDVLYVAVGLFLISRSRPLLRGFGAAVILQGGFLLLFDTFWWLRLAP